jgi:hypothetical protein
MDAGFSSFDGMRNWKESTDLCAFIVTTKKGRLGAAERPHSSPSKPVQPFSKLGKHLAENGVTD